MDVKIRETGEVKELSIRNRNGMDYTYDLVGNAGAFNDGQFEWSEEDSAQMASQETYEWWARYLANTLDTEADVEALAKKLGVQESDIWPYIERAQGYDYEDHRTQAQQAMEEFTAEHNGRQNRISVIVEALEALKRGVQQPTIVRDGESFEYIPGAYLTDASYTGSRDVVFDVSEEAFGDFDVGEASDQEIREAAEFAADHWGWKPEEYYT